MIGEAIGRVGTITGSGGGVGYVGVVGESCGSCDDDLLNPNLE